MIQVLTGEQDRQLAIYRCLLHERTRGGHKDSPEKINCRVGRRRKDLSVPAVRKRRHHSVWKYYLRAWAPNGKLFCLQGDKIFDVGLGQVAVDRDLYVLEALSGEELEFVRALTVREPGSEAEKQIDSWLDFLTLPTRASEALLRAGAKPADPLLVRFFNFGEDFQSHIEDNAVGFLDALRRRDASFLRDERSYAVFLFFMLLQFFRTSKWPETIHAAITPVPGVRFERVWKVLPYLFAHNVGGAIYCERMNWRLVFLESCSSSSFVTSDQPLFNTVSLPESRSETSTELRIYYPISPRLAIHFSEETKIENGTIIALSTAETHSYNRLVHANSHRQVYGETREILETLGTK
jgi:hypothetical protein